MTAADTMSLDGLVGHARRLERLGYDAMWMPDVFGREIYVTAGYVLANTSRLRVASGIAHIYGRDPIASAQAARTLSELSQGRFIQGLGVSHPIAAEIRGVPWEDPVAKTRDYLTAMARAPIRTPPSPPVPVYLAAHGPKMLGVAAEAADGANTYMMPPEHTAEARQILGPDRSLNVCLPCCLSTDTDAARAAARRAISMYLPLPAYQRQWVRYGFDDRDWSDGGSDRLVDTFVAWGDEATLRDRFAAHIDAGATEIELAALNPDPDDRGAPWDLLETLAPG